MSDRAQEITAFLEAQGLAAARRDPIAGDMSPRRYWRVTYHDKSVVLMDADTPMTPFVQMTGWLAKVGLSVPKIYAADPQSGLVLMEDFGSTSIKSTLAEENHLEDEIFNECITLLLNIRRASPPTLLQPTAQDLVEWTRLADEHYPHTDSDGLQAFRSVLLDTLAGVLGSNCSVSLRDFHTENMMWLPQRIRHLRLGLLDYQDAFITHPAYDLMSLLTDARTWVSAPLRRRIRDRYIARSGDDPESFQLAFAALSAQRNLRILGIFTRAKRHLNYMPNTYRYFAEALEHPIFDEVRNSTLRALPAPSDTV